MEERLHYLCRLRFTGTEMFVVWHSGERDGFVRDEAGRLRAARFRYLSGALAPCFPTASHRSSITSVGLDGKVAGPDGPRMSRPA